MVQRSIRSQNIANFFRTQSKTTVTEKNVTNLETTVTTSGCEGGSDGPVEVNQIIIV